jgi:2-hydroxy-palmitic acid dioxygenase Mpo1-like protein
MNMSLSLWLIEQGEVAPISRLLGEHRLQRRLWHLQHAGGAFGDGIVGARLAVDQGDLPEPVGRRHQHQQRFLAALAHPADADGAFDHAIQAAGLVSAWEQPLARAQPAHHGRVEQSGPQLLGNFLEPATAEDEGPPGLHAFVCHSVLGETTVSATRQTRAVPGATWLSAGLGLFVVGWIIQFVGHSYEGRKPAFVDDLIGLIVGPLFVVAELGFFFGLRDEVCREVEARAGPTCIRRGNEARA